MKRRITSAIDVDTLPVFVSSMEDLFVGLGCRQISDAKYISRYFRDDNEILLIEGTNLRNIECMRLYARDPQDMSAYIDTFIHKDLYEVKHQIDIDISDEKHVEMEMYTEWNGLSSLIFGRVG